MKLPPAAFSLSLALHACVAAAVLQWAVGHGRDGAVGDAPEMAIGFEVLGEVSSAAPGTELAPPAPEIEPPSAPEELVAEELLESATIDDQPDDPPVPAITTIAPAVALAAVPSSRAAASQPEARPSTRKSGGQRGSGAGAGRSGGRGNANFVPPSYRNCPAPPFPIEARREGRGGVVLLTVAVDKSGVPTSVSVHRSSGSAVLDRAAIAAVKRWRFEPAHAGSEPVAARVEIPIRFRI